MTWFGGGAARDDREAEFLAVLCAEAAGWGIDGIGPDDTSAMTSMHPLYVDVMVPGLPHGVNHNTVLQGGYWAGGPGALTLQGEWGDVHLLDAGGNQDDFRLGGVTLAPAQAASILANWFETQLRRPIERLDWTDAGGAVTASEWRLADTGRRLAAEGSWLRRRRPPTSRGPI